MAANKSIVQLPDARLATLNMLLVSPSYYQQLRKKHGDSFLLKINGYFFMLHPNDSVRDESIAIPSETLELINLEVDEPISCSDIQRFNIREDFIEHISMKLLYSKFYHM